MEFLRIQILTDGTGGTRTRATHMLAFKFFEICSTPCALRPAPLRHVCGGLQQGDRECPNKRFAEVYEGGKRTFTRTQENITPNANANEHANVQDACTIIIPACTC